MTPPLDYDLRLSLSDRTRPSGAVARFAGACRYCARREHLRRTARIAFVVGVLLTVINQADVILSGKASAATAVRCALNFVVPFVVSNLGLLGGRPRDTTGRE